MICLALILQQFQIRRDQFVHKIMENKLEKIVALAKRRGFIFPGSEIYGGISGIYDYGPLGVEFKNKKCSAGRIIFLSWIAVFLCSGRCGRPLDILPPDLPIRCGSAKNATIDIGRIIWPKKALINVRIAAGN